MTLAINEWNALSAEARKAALARPAAGEREELSAKVGAIINAVQAEGDAALRRLTEQFDGVRVSQLRVSDEEFQFAQSEITPAQRAALERAVTNVRRFHEAQRGKAIAIETEPGVLCERFEIPIRAVGLYVPAGSAPLPSTAIMNAVPAEIAGCPMRVLCTPPRKDGRADPAVLVVAKLTGIPHVFKVGGAQAIAAMAYGTDSIPKVDKVFGPGNAWVTAAKLHVSQDPSGAALDLPAGPSEVLVIADDSARAEFVAADLLAQAEHDPRSHVVLLTTSRALAEATLAEIAKQSALLSRESITRQSLTTSQILVVPDVETAIAISNDYAPEHLMLEVRDPRSWLPLVRAAGSVFLGHWTPEPLGDYCSGTNHVLPTYGYARAYSGLSLGDFVRRITVQEASPDGLRALGPVAAILSEMEGLDAHTRAISIRLAALQRGAL